MARNTEGTHDNTENNLEICKRLVNLRREIAQLLGYETYADYVLVHRMASNAENVYKLLNDLIDAYMPTAKLEVADIEKKAKSMEGDDFKLEPWDFSFYSHKLQLEKFNLDAEMLRPYFELSRVIDGVFGLANRLYGITFKENKDIPVYHPDVKAYEVFDKDGSYLAVFYADFHPRKGKQGGAWMTEYQGQWIDKKGENVRPHVSVVMNFTKPTAEKPALLTLGEVETFLHEFGHSLHGMFANTRFESLSGTNVWWDFVELPSQFMENYGAEKEFLRTFAFHYKTGEPLPDELIERIRKSRNFNEVCDVNPFGVIALQAAYSDEGYEWLTQLRKYISANYDLLLERFARELPKCKVMRMEGTYLAWIDCSELHISSDEIEEMLMHENKVWVNAGSMYGAEGAAFIRINMACTSELLNEGITRIVNGLGAY